MSRDLFADRNGFAAARRAFVTKQNAPPPPRTASPGTGRPPARRTSRTRRRGGRRLTSSPPPPYREPSATTTPDGPYAPMSSSHQYGSGHRRRGRPVPAGPRRGLHVLAAGNARVDGERRVVDRCCF